MAGPLFNMPHNSGTGLSTVNLMWVQSSVSGALANAGTIVLTTSVVPLVFLRSA